MTYTCSNKYIENDYSTLQESTKTAQLYKKLQQENNNGKRL